MKTMLWVDYIKQQVNILIEQYGGVREVSRQFDIDVALVSKMKNGKYIPSYKTFYKLFPELKPVKAEYVVLLEEDV